MIQHAHKYICIYVIHKVSYTYSDFQRYGFSHRVLYTVYKTNLYIAYSTELTNAQQMCSLMGTEGQCMKPFWPWPRISS